MKYFQNDGSEQYALQNEFTAYLQVAIRRAKARYLSKQHHVAENEFSNDPLWMCDIPQAQGNVAFSSTQSVSDYGGDRLELELFVADVLSMLSEREVAIIKGKIFDGYTFPELSIRLELDVNTIKSIYYRSLKKLRDMLTP